MADETDLRGLLEAAEDELFQKIVDRMEGMQGMQGIEESRLAKEEPSQEELLKWNTALDKLERQLTQPKKCKSNKRRWIAVLAAILAATLLASANAYHIMNWFETVREKYTLIHQENSISSEISRWEGAFVPDEVPKDFTISDALCGDDMLIIEYADTAGHRIVFYQYSPGANILIDTEKADKVIDYKVADYTAYLYYKGELITLYWNNGAQVFSFEFGSHTTEQEILDMAASLKKQ